MLSRNNTILFALCAVLLLLWLPGLRYPIISDTALYALLGESLWHGEGYMVFGQAYAKHLPFHAFASYPFVWLFGYHVGMKVSTLVAGWAVIIMTYMLLRCTISESVALLAAGCVTLHHGFVLMSMLGSADLLFTALFISSLYAYSRVKEDVQWYIPAFILAGAACLTRYNGMPLFVLFLGDILLHRRNDLKTSSFWIGLVTGSFVFGLWFFRNAFVFGDPFFTEYTSELSTETMGFLPQIFSNTFYYLNPLHNLLPILFFFAIIGLIRHAKQYPFLLIAMLSAWVFTSFWWVQAIRFAFPGYPILFGFAALGIFDVLKMFESKRTLLIGAIAAGLIFTHIPSLCVYAYGSCNTMFDRTIGFIPKDLHLTPEGFYTWSVARDELNRIAEPNGFVLVESPETVVTWKQGVFREDLRVTERKDVCPRYRLTRLPEDPEVVIYTTPDEPKTSIAVVECEN